MIFIINKLLAIGTILAQVFIACGILYLLFFRQHRDKAIVRFFTGNAIALAFLVSLIAALSSLFYSEIAGFEPCRLCWYQRIFLYPQVVLLGLAWIKKDFKIIDYSLALATIGAAISAYNNYIYFQSQASIICEAGNSCATPYVLEFGYITIPVMALTGFALTITLLLGRKISDDSQ